VLATFPYKFSEIAEVKFARAGAFYCARSS
jgi:hypothetical protein